MNLAYADIARRAAQRYRSQPRFDHDDAFQCAAVALLEHSPTTQVSAVRVIQDAVAAGRSASTYTVPIPHATEKRLRRMQTLATADPRDVGMSPETHQAAMRAIHEADTVVYDREAADGTDDFDAVTNRVTAHQILSSLPQRDRAGMEIWMTGGVYTTRKLRRLWQLSSADEVEAKVNQILAQLRVVVAADEA